jgi:hypothetical protein
MSAHYLREIARKYYLDIMHLDDDFVRLIACIFGAPLRFFHSSDIAGEDPQI